MENTLKISLASARVNAGLTQEESAIALNVSKRTISLWETGKSHPKMNHMIALGNLYQISLDNIDFLRN